MIQNISFWAVRILSALLIISPALLALMNVGILSQISGDLFIPILYYWIVFLPQRFPFWVLLPLGFLIDAALSVPLGFHTLIWATYATFVFTQRRYLYNRPFPVHWAGFCATFILTYPLKAVLLHLAKLPQAWSWQKGISVLLVIALYPCFFWACHQTLKLMRRYAPTPH